MKGGTGGSRLSVLLLENAHSGQANTVRDQVAALARISRHDVRRFDPVGVGDSLLLDFDEFDAVVIHWSVAPLFDDHLAPALRDRLGRFAGLKVQMVQDDYRWVNQVTDRMIELGIGVLFTLVPEREVDNVWKAERLPGVEKITVLAGYVPEGAENAPRPPLAERPLDIVYRGRDVPYWLGRLAQEKAWIGREVAARARAHGLAVDIGWREEVRIYGRDWESFLRSGRATLGSESGSSITDFDGSLQRRVDDYLLRHPGAEFEEVHRELLAPYEGNVMMNIVSPRVFEAIAAGTALVLFPGEYSGVIEPERHYIPLQKDLSNFGEVVERLRDLEGLKELTDRAHEEIVASGRYSVSNLVEQLDQVLDEHGQARPSASGRTKPRYAASRVEARLSSSGRKIRDAVDALAKTALAIRMTKDWPEGRALLGRYLRGSIVRFRPVAPTALSVGDLARLALMRTFAAAGRMQVRTDGDTVIYTTSPEAQGGPVETNRAEPAAERRPDAAELEAMPNGSPERVLWDHSAIAPKIKWEGPWGRTLTFPLGTDGVHEFDGIAALGPQMPETVRALLQSLTPASDHPQPARGADGRDRVLGGVFVDSR